MGNGGVWAGAERASGTALNTAFNFAQLQATARHQRALESESASRLALEGDRLKLATNADVRASDLSGVQIATAKLALNEAKKKQEFLDSGWEPSIDPFVKALPEQEQKDWLARVDSMGIPKTQRGRQQAAEMLESSTKLYGEYTKSAFAKKYTDYQTVESEYNAALQKGDKDKIAEIKLRFDAAAAEIHRSRGEIDKGMKIVAMNETWNQLSPELKATHPELGPLYQIGQRTGDIKPFTDAVEEIGKVKTPPVETWGPETTGQGGTTVQRSSRGQIKTVYKPVKPTAEKSARVPTTADIKQVGEMVTALNETNEPKPNDIELAKTAAAKVGYNLVNITGEKPGTLWGTNKTSEWKLEPIGGGQQSATTVKSPAGFKLDPKGRKVNGKPAYISADGKKVWIP